MNIIYLGKKLRIDGVFFSCIVLVLFNFKVVSLVSKLQIAGLPLCTSLCWFICSVSFDWHCVLLLS